MFKPIKLKESHDITKLVKAKNPGLNYNLTRERIMRMQEKWVFVFRAQNKTLAQVKRWIPALDEQIRNLPTRTQIAEALYDKYNNNRQQYETNKKLQPKLLRLTQGQRVRFSVDNYRALIYYLKQNHNEDLIQLSYDGVNWRSLYIYKFNYNDNTYNGVEITETTEESGSDVEHFQEITNHSHFYAKLQTQQDAFGIRRLMTQGYFKHLNKTYNIDLKRYQIYKKHKKEVMPCVKHCLNLLNINTKSVYKSIALERISNKTIGEIAQKLDVRIKLTQMKPCGNDTHYDYNNTATTIINLGSVDGHIFINEATKYPIYAIKNYDSLQSKPKPWYKYKKANELVKKKDKRATSYQIIKWMYLNGKFTPMTQKQLMQTIYYKPSDLTTAEETIKSDTRKVLPNPDKKPIDTLIFADTEASTDGIHSEYMLSFQVWKLQDDDNYKMVESDDYFCSDCVYKFLNIIANKYDLTKTYIYFHNLAYDIKFFINKLGVIIESTVKMGSKIYAANIRFKKNTYYFKDSLPMLSGSLRSLSKVYLPSHQQKEIYPYNYYTKDRIVKMYAGEVCSDFLTGLDAEYSGDDYLHGKELFERLNSCPIAYAKYYCQRDVECLAKVFLKFRGILLASVDLDPVDYISSASLAMSYVKRDECLNDTVEISGIPRAFIQKCFYGGRVMCAKNQKHHTTIPLVDYDAVSLYPSAMARIKGMITGKPKLLTDFDANTVYTQIPESFDSYSYFFCRIKIISIGKERDFPIICKRDETGNHYVNECIDNYYVGKVDLEDLIKFQQISFKIYDGYYFIPDSYEVQLKEQESKKKKKATKQKIKELKKKIKNKEKPKLFNSTINTTIKKLFSKRLKMKKLKDDNPLKQTEQAYKLIMNSSYGKLAMKPRDTELKFKYSDKRYLFRNKHRIASIDSVGDLDIVKVKKEINSHYNSVHNAAYITAMSRRIMNEVMCLAEDNGIQIYYQDTDSMHMKRDDLFKLKSLYRLEYGRELDGEGMGQFNSDFKIKDSTDTKCSDVHAVESYFLGKKCYIDKLKGYSKVDGELESYHIRMKGVPNATIKYTARKLNCSVMDLYAKLYEGEEIEFDLLHGGEVFKLKTNSNMTQETIKEFKRKIKFI